MALVDQFLCQNWVAGHERDAEEAPEHLLNVAARWFGVVGLTLSCETHVDRLTIAIAGMRRASQQGRRHHGRRPGFLQKPESVAHGGRRCTSGSTHGGSARSTTARPRRTGAATQEWCHTLTQSEWLGFPHEEIEHGQREIRSHEGDEQQEAHRPVG